MVKKKKKKINWNSIFILVLAILFLSSLSLNEVRYRRIKKNLEVHKYIMMDNNHAIDITQKCIDAIIRLLHKIQNPNI